MSYAAPSILVFPPNMGWSRSSIPSMPSGSPPRPMWSQAHEGWRCLPTQYNDGGFSGGSLNRPALQKLLSDMRDRRLDVVVVYKVDRLTRSLADFAKLVELFDAHGVSFVSVTQA